MGGWLLRFIFKVDSLVPSCKLIQTFVTLQSDRWMFLRTQCDSCVQGLQHAVEWLDAGDQVVRSGNDSSDYNT